MARSNKQMFPKGGGSGFGVPQLSPGSDVQSRPFHVIMSRIDSARPQVARRHGYGAPLLRRHKEYAAAAMMYSGLICFSRRNVQFILTLLSTVLPWPRHPL